ncbi:MAG: septum site-determining protein MinC [Desulfobacterales bacterium]|nr:septum site-determining protein MinC [Desulfobacterales bacterium]
MIVFNDKKTPTIKALKESIPSVRLKGVGDSLWVTLDPNLDIEYIKKELSVLFERLKHLAVNSRIIIDTGKEEGYDQLIEELGDFLKKTFYVGLVSKPPKKRSPEEEKLRRDDMNTSWDQHNSDALIITGRVRSGQKIKAKNHLIIFGNVNPGAEVSAGGDIVVLGSLCGTCMAGFPVNEEAIIFALDFRPTQVQIGGYIAAGIPSSQKQPEYAYVENCSIVVEDYIKSNPFGNLPWPKVR